MAIPTSVAALLLAFAPIALRAEPSAATNAKAGVQIEPHGAELLASLTYDGSKESLDAIVNALQPQARAGNIVAISICRQALLGLNDDSAPELLPEKMVKDLDRDLIRAWFDAVQRKAEAGDAFFRVVQGIFYIEGTGVEKSAEKGLELLRKSLVQGYHDAAFKLGIFCKTGGAGEKDAGKAVAYYRKAADFGSALAAYNLGCMYIKGDGVKQDASEAAKQFARGASMGHAASEYHLGFCYLRGQGVPEDDTLGKLWLKKAAMQGHQGAKKALAELMRGVAAGR
jgi:TPR repeat protein